MSLVKKRVCKEIHYFFPFHLLTHSDELYHVFLLRIYVVKVNTVDSEVIGFIGGDSAVLGTNFHPSFHLCFLYEKCIQMDHHFQDSFSLEEQLTIGQTRVENCSMGPPLSGAS